MPNNALSPDELISAYLDNVATPKQIERVESDPVLLRRVDSMRATIETVGAPVSFPDMDLDRIRAAAISPTSASRVLDLAVARASRAQRLNRVALIAAAFVFLSLGATVVLNGISSTDYESADDSSDTAASDVSALSNDADATSFDAETAAAATAGDDRSFDAAESAPMDDIAGDQMATMDPEAVAPTAETTVSDGVLSLLPDELPPIPNVGALQVVVIDLTSSIDPVMVTQSQSNSAQLIELCPPVLEAISLAQTGGTRLVDTASVTVAGQPAIVVVAVGHDNTVVAFVAHGVGCESVEALATGLP